MGKNGQKLGPNSDRVMSRYYCHSFLIKKKKSTLKEAITSFTSKKRVCIYFLSVKGY